MVPTPSEFYIKYHPENEEFPFVLLHREVGSHNVTHVFQVSLAELSRLGRSCRELVDTHIHTQFANLNIPEKIYCPTPEK